MQYHNFSLPIMTIYIVTLEYAVDFTVHFCSLCLLQM